MRVFETGINGHHKLNFVDDNNIFVGFNYCVNCCEIFDYKITESEPQTYEHLEKFQQTMFMIFQVTTSMFHISRDSLKTVEKAVLLYSRQSMKNWSHFTLS